VLNKQKGDLAVANAIQYYMTNGYEVCLPIGDKRPYDLVAEVDGELKRVQVKYAGFYSGIKQYKVALRITGGNQSFKSAKKYSESDFDELFVYTANGRKFALPWADVTARNELNIEHQKYSAYEIV
jgi:PD-(D/E)XK nuclease superfamily protein